MFDRMFSESLLPAVLALCVLTSCGLESTRLANVTTEDIAGIWHGHSIDPDRPSRNMNQQPCWIMERKTDGTYNIAEFIVDHEKRLYTKIGAEKGGHWRLDGELLILRLPDEDVGREYRVSRRGELLEFRRPGSQEYYVEERIENLPSDYLPGYRGRSEAEFDSR